MSDGPKIEKEEQEALSRDRAREFADSLKRTGGMLRTRAERLLEKCKKNGSPKVSKNALAAAKDYYFFNDLIQLVKAKNDENLLLAGEIKKQEEDKKILQELVNHLSEKCSLVELPAKPTAGKVSN